MQVLFSEICRCAASGAVFRSVGAISSRYRNHEAIGTIARVYTVGFSGLGNFIFWISLYLLSNKLAVGTSKKFSFIYWVGGTFSIIGVLAMDKRFADKKLVKALYVMGEVASFVAVSGVFASVVLETDPLEKILCKQLAMVQVPYLALKGYDSLQVFETQVMGVPSPLIKLEPTEKEAHYLGQDKLFEQVLGILSSEIGGNIILKGPAGVGKTQFMYSLAFKINRKEIPRFEGCSVYSVSGTELMSGSKWQGTLEEKVRTIGNFLKCQKRAILFIDEIHQLVVDSSASELGVSDIAGQLLPYLTHPKVRVVGATTPDEGKRLDRNTPFLQRFNLISIPEITSELRKNILEDLIQIQIKKGKTFPEGFAEEIRHFNHVNRRRSPREDKDLLMMIVSIMERQNLTASEAFKSIIESKIMTRDAESIPTFLTEFTINPEEVNYIERKEEIEYITDILNSDQVGSNVVLIGQPGSGKTEMIRFIASQIGAKTMGVLNDFKVYSASVQQLMAGTASQGTLEARVIKLFNFLEGEGDVILFVDEIDQLIGNRSLDQMFLKILQDPQIRVFGATTPEKAAFLEERFNGLKGYSKIILAPMDGDLRKKVLEKAIEEYKDSVFSKDFVEKLICFNTKKGKTTATEDKQVLGILVSRMNRLRITDEKALESLDKYFGPLMPSLQLKNSSSSSVSLNSQELSES